MNTITKVSIAYTQFYLDNSLVIPTWERNMSDLSRHVLILNKLLGIKNGCAWIIMASLVVFFLASLTLVK